MKKNLVNYNLIDIYIGEKIKELRKKHGYSLVDVATTIGVSKQRYANYEAAIRSMPMDIYKKVCKIYNVDAEELFKEAQDYMRTEVFKNADLQEE